MKRKISCSDYGFMEKNPLKMTVENLLQFFRIYHNLRDIYRLV